ncbi:ferritin-like domain-containing protein [Gilvibacter sediminis]|uniref:ferritin-like domain-containing protein n=1 Tax=Gilvibacter sediminis TaxID=379071 RepID=UPI00235045FF|nr:PA2169 family four-helix-bundle protein [Gilvibacter sediminis]MDC7997022.1 PA2169 family four-helix-bundle protein [Gilvibacter sediminis]
MKTTLEKAKENIHDNQVNSLNDLLERTYDAEAGYKKAMELAKDDYLTEFLKRRAAQRSQFANELDREIRSMNETPVSSGSTKAALHRSWMDTRAFISGTTDESILNECIRGEKASLDTYSNTLEETNFSPEVSSMLNKQMDGIKNSLQDVKNLEAVEEVVNSF